MSGSCWYRWVGVRSDRLGGRVSATKTRFATGGTNNGQPLKKSPQRGPHDRLHRRERNKPAAAPLPNLGAARADSRPAVQLQLEDVVRHCRPDVLELLLPASSWLGQKRAGGGFSGSAGPTDRWSAADCLGSSGGTSQSSGAGLPRWPARSRSRRVPAGLCSRTESRRIHLGVLGTARTAERVPEGLLATGSSCPPDPPQDAAPSAARSGLLEAGFFVARVTLYYAGVNSYAMQRPVSFPAFDPVAFFDPRFRNFLSPVAPAIERLLS